MSAKRALLSCSTSLKSSASKEAKIKWLLSAFFAVRVPFINSKAWCYFRVTDIITVFKCDKILMFMTQFPNMITFLNFLLLRNFPVYWAQYISPNTKFILDHKKIICWIRYLHFILFFSKIELPWATKQESSPDRSFGYIWWHALRQTFILLPFQPSRIFLATMQFSQAYN